MDGVAAVAGIVDADGAARLHGGGGDAVDDEAMLHHMGGAREGGVGRGLVAEQLDEGNIIRAFVVDARRARLDRLGDRGDGGERLVVDRDQLGAVHRLRGGFGHDKGDTVADPAHAIFRQHGVARQRHGLSSAPFQSGMARQVAEAGRLPVGGGDHRQHAGRSLRRARIDRLDPGVRVRRTQHHAEGHAGINHVVDIMPAAAHQARVLEARHALADGEFTHAKICLLMLLSRREDQRVVSI
jgi:hypothetical protein